VRLVFATRDPAAAGLHDLAGLVAYGASPRASLGIVAGARALALMRGRDYALPQDLTDVAPDVLRHRLVLSYDALADGVPADHVVSRVLAGTPVPQVSPRQSADPRENSGATPPPPAGPPLDFAPPQKRGETA
jgi:MoxR-like ATPase